MKTIALRLLVAGIVALPISGQSRSSPNEPWLTRVAEELARQEYRFSALADAAGSWSAPNRAHDFRSRISSGGLEVVPRDAQGAPWKLVLATQSFGRVGDAVALDAATLHATDARVELDHRALTEWFVNDERGLEQGWSIARPPAGTERLWIGLEFGGDLSLRIDASGTSGTLVDAAGDIRLRYTGLVAFDARGRELDARLESSPDGVGISVDDANAIYPLTVDPVLTGPAWTFEGDQAGARFGVCVAPAGDVDGDGYGDVIVGAHEYDNGEVNEGRAFVYLGSAAGLSTSAAWTAESDQASAEYGVSVATAGDVNGDGYSDVIIGAYVYDNGESDEGRAYLYLGSDAGLSASAVWTAESDQDSGYFGITVATAGDVNGDGYSDVIVGAYGYDNGESDEGRAFVYLGSSAGLATTAAWTAEGNQVGAAFGNSVAAAGDANGDGYGDVIVGQFAFTNGEPQEGRALVYLGSASGLATSAAWSAEGNQGAALFGMSVATAGDVNGDGYGDVIVGAGEYSNGQTSEGRAFVYLGSGAGLATSPAWTAESDQSFAFFGASVGTAGDVNGDGYSDVIVGSSFNDNGQADEGRASVYLGSSAGLASSAAWTAESDQANANFGLSAVTAGDVNGDGYSDVIVGAPQFSNGQALEGRVFVYLGSALGLATSDAWTARGNQAGAEFGRSVASAGDVNGDGYSDVIVGAPKYDNGESDEGRAFAFLGSENGLSNTPVWAAESDTANASFGDAVSGAGDVNGDGYSDVIVGASNYSNGETAEGRAFVYLGSSAGLSASAVWTVESNQVSARLGVSVATAGDVNGDGFGDVILGADGFDNGQANEGRAFLYLGSPTGLAATAAWTAEGDSFSATFGASVAGAGDVNRDGFSDVIVGAPLFTNPHAFQGRAYVYLGSSAGLAASATWTAEVPADGAQFGGSVSSAGDVNGDGYSDVLIGADGYKANVIQDGRAYVYLGSETGPSTTAAWSAEGNQALGGFGRSVSSAGDVNGDGYSDVIVGAHAFDDGQVDEGRAFVYLGSASGLATTAAWTAESDRAGAFFGWSVSTAGDVDGDGFSDVIIGARYADEGNIGEGRAVVCMGNEGRGGWTLAPRQRQADDSAPIGWLGRSKAASTIRIRLGFERRLTGFSWASGASPTARLEWEVRPLRDSLDGTHVESGTEQPVTGAPLTFDELVQCPSAGPPSLTVVAPLHGLDVARAFHWRARVRTNNPLFPVTPWVTIPGNNVTESKLRLGPRTLKR